MKFFSKLSAFFSPLVYFFITPSLAFAQIKTCAQPPFDKLCFLTQQSFAGVVGTLITVAFVLAVVITLAFLVYGGIKWILSGGDKAAIESARNTIVAAVVGLVIVFLSYFILNIVLGFFQINLQTLSLPTLTF